MDGLMMMGDLSEGNRSDDASVLEQMADEAWMLGFKSWDEINKFESEVDDESLSTVEGRSESCALHGYPLSGDELVRRDSIMLWLGCWFFYHCDFARLSMHILKLHLVLVNLE
uniref:Uncharacterized protein n=1 Tax=Kalanchoe fedtschenkoi TaxID=63787 RepID=A0A7N0VHC8_KALFE